MTSRVNNELREYLMGFYSGHSQVRIGRDGMVQAKTVGMESIWVFMGWRDELVKEMQDEKELIRNGRIKNDQDSSARLQD